MTVAPAKASAKRHEGGKIVVRMLMKFLELHLNGVLRAAFSTRRKQPAAAQRCGSIPELAEVPSSDRQRRCLSFITSIARQDKVFVSRAGMPGWPPACERASRKDVQTASNPNSSGLFPAGKGLETAFKVISPTRLRSACSARGAWPGRCCRKEIESSHRPWQRPPRPDGCSRSAKPQVGIVDEGRGRRRRRSRFSAA